MGEIAEAMLDGTFCSECGVYIGEGDGFPRPCRDCTSLGPTERADRRSEAGNEFDLAEQFAAANGLKLLQRSEQHYQLIGPDWLLDVYPGNLRLYRPRPGTRHPKRAPYLRVPIDWDLVDVVRAAIEVNDGTETPSQAS